MPDQLIENEIQAKGLTAPRVTPADIENEISLEWYFTAADGARSAYYAGHQDRPGDDSPLHLLTFCVLVLRNGYTVTGESACASPENFDAELGRKIARQNAVTKIWPLLGFRLRDKLAGVGGDGAALAQNPNIAARNPKVPALIQTQLSQQLLPGEWLLVNMQIDGADKGIAEVDYWRIRLNTGCGPQGELEGQPAAFRGFEQADTPAERVRLDRANSTARVHDVKRVDGRYELDIDTHLVDVAGIERIKAHPRVHAVRVANWAALDEWIRFTAGGRPNKAD